MIMYFDTYYCDESNKKAFDFAKRVADLDKKLMEDGKEIDCILLVGASGCGKSHLASGIFEAASEKYQSKKKLSYVSYEEIMRGYLEVFHACDDGIHRIESYKNDISDVDLLIIDDTDRLQDWMDSSREEICDMVHRCVRRGGRVVTIALTDGNALIRGIEAEKNSHLLKIDFPSSELKQKYVEEEYGNEKITKEEVKRLCEENDTLPQLDGAVKTFLFACGLSKAQAE